MRAIALALLLSIAMAGVAYAETAPDFSLESLDGTVYTLDDLLEGKTLLALIFWCPT